MSEQLLVKFTARTVYVPGVIKVPKLTASPAVDTVKRGPK